MKFIDAWDSIAKENKTLKVLLFCMSGVSIFLAIAVFKSAVKDPLVIERGCFSKVVSAQKVQTTEDEFKEFVKEALAARFSSNSNQPSLLSLGEKEKRDQEQKDLSSRTMKQTLVVEDVQVIKDKITVQTSRLISVGEIRSAFPFQLSLKVESTDRSYDNPYGLILTDVQAINQKDGKNESK